MDVDRDHKLHMRNSYMVWFVDLVIADLIS